MKQDTSVLICQCCHVRNISLVSCETAKKRERSYACALLYLHLAVLSLFWMPTSSIFEGVFCECYIGLKSFRDLYI